MTMASESSAPHPPPISVPTPADGGRPEGAAAAAPDSHVGAPQPRGADNLDGDAAGDGVPVRAGILVNGQGGGGEGDGQGDAVGGEQNIAVGEGEGEGARATNPVVRTARVVVDRGEPEDSDDEEGDQEASGLTEVEDGDVLVDYPDDTEVRPEPSVRASMPSSASILIL